MMEAFEKHFDKLQSTILAREYNSQTGTDCPCGDGKSDYRCEECFSSTPSCRQCLVRSHQDLPLHHVQQWTGTHFNRTCLSEMGLVLCLGHGTVRCPNAPVGSKGRPTVIVHTNGIHKLNIEFCCCAHASPDPFQLTSAGLFPATTDQPETAFSFTVLKEFHAHTLSSKKSGYDYFIALRKLTNNAFPDETYVRVCRN
jgi:CxC2 like cysteine cluster associated with KDZ transposases